MHMNRHTLALGLVLSAAFLVASPGSAFAQGGNKRQSAPKVGTIATITLSPELRVQVKTYYANFGASDTKALPPGIRKRLARGKGLPPGIAKRAVPADLRSRIRLPAGYEIVEVGLDVVLVEVATSIVHDILTDIVL